MKLYGRTTSFNVQKVMWLLEELKLSYEHVELGGRFGGLDSEAFAELNPMRKVPVLIDGDRAIWESHSILRYLAAEYGSDDWLPESAYSRSLYERWMDWSQVTFQPAFMATFWGYYRTPETKRDMQRVTQALQTCDVCLQQLEVALTNQSFLAGESISLADVCAGAILYRLTEQGLDVVLPFRVNQWFERLQSRPGYQKWVMSDFSELKAREDY